MHITLLGGTGFVGAHLARALSGQGHQLNVLTRNAATHGELRLLPGTRLTQTDIHDHGALDKALANSEAVINLVGILNERGFGGRGFHRAHVELTEKVIQACQRQQIRRYLHMSALNAGQGESHYLKSKGQAEELILHAVNSGGLDATIFQPSVIFGEGDSFIKRFADLLKLTPALPLAMPNALFQPVWVGDVVSAFAHSLNNRNTIGSICPLVGPRTYSLREIVAYTARQLGRRRLIISLPKPIARLQAMVMDFVPGKPFSTDNFLSLQIDSISTTNALSQFEIQPQAMENIVPDYLTKGRHQKQLDQFRRRAGRG